MIGKLDQRVTIQTRTAASDGGGGTTYAWATVATVWAHAKPRVARETMQEGRINASQVITFTIRNRAIDETQRLVWRGEAYNIRAVMREGPRPLYLAVDAERGVAN
jgi:SPP1 family predicted phage head-tail adaptor